MSKPRLPDPDGVTLRDIRSYERGERLLREIASSRPILNPHGPTPLIPAERRPITLSHTFWDECSTEPA